MGIARDAHEAHSASQIAEDVNRVKNMAKKGAEWNPDWWVGPSGTQVPDLGKLPRRGKSAARTPDTCGRFRPGPLNGGGVTPSPN